MAGVQIGILALILLVIPTVIGMLFAAKADKGSFLPFSWVSGQILLWAGFLVISIPLILLEKSFSLVVSLFHAYTGVLLVLSIIARAVRYKRCGDKSCSGIGRQEINPCRSKEGRRKGNSILWLVFGLLLLIQLVLTVCMAYEEGDDAFYVAISTITDAANNMYQLLPYTGTGTGLDARHGLAPFPIWVAYLARTSGIPAVTVAQVVLPLVLILMAYGIYYLIATKLFDGNRNAIPFFMILTEVLVLFGGYSVFSAENFLLVRASQGKAVIANIIIPFLLYLMMIFLRRLQEAVQEADALGLRLQEAVQGADALGLKMQEQADGADGLDLRKQKPEQRADALGMRSQLKPVEDKVAKNGQAAEMSFWILLGLTMMAGCLCSTLGTMLTCMFLGIVGVCAAVTYRRWQHLIPMALCCIIPANIAILYFFSV